MGMTSEEKTFHGFELYHSIDLERVVLAATCVFERHLTQ